MDKNTIIAVILSTLVVAGTFIIQPKLFPGAAASDRTGAQTERLEEAAAENPEEAAAGTMIFAEDAPEAEDTEQSVTVRTNRVEVVLTNRGGDIVSYKLTDHIDVETGDGVQMSDNVSGDNRTCALAFGGADGAIVSGLFSVEKINDYTVLFTRKFVRADADGAERAFVLGKRYTFAPDEYMFRLDILIHSEDGAGGLDFNGAAYTLRTSPQIGPHFDPKLNRYETRQFISYNGNKAKKVTLGSRQFKQYNKDYVWNGIAGKYFAELVVPESNMNMDFAYYSTQVAANGYADAQALLVRRAVTESDVRDTYYMYFGPRNEKDLRIYNTAENNAWHLSGLRLTECLQSSGWLGWLETILKWIMEILYKVIPNWGVSIILMTILLKLAMFPFTKKQSLSTLRMQELQPQIQSIQTKYKDNPQKQQEMLAKFYKESGYNPMSGCLPMIVQFLIIFAMYNLFNNYFEFRGASFIPNWIPDLSAGDSIYRFKKSIPFFGNQLRILPIIYLASQLFYGKITQNGGTAAVGSTKVQMNMMMYGMPVIFFFLFYNAPSGLLLYWTVSNLFQMGQQIVINKTMKEKRAGMSVKK